MKKKNPTGIALTDAGILLGAGAVIGLLGYWAYTKWQASQESESAASAPQFTGMDSSGNPTYKSVTPGGIGVFTNQTPGPVGPAVGS